MTATEGLVILPFARSTAAPSGIATSPTSLTCENPALFFSLSILFEQAAVKSMAGAFHSQDVAAAGYA